VVDFILSSHFMSHTSFFVCSLSKCSVFAIPRFKIIDFTIESSNKKLSWYYFNKVSAMRF
ncbi:MAG: hypothetical protein ACI91R_001249, partial [Vicingaceae bacterium]